MADTAARKEAPPVQAVDDSQPPVDGENIARIEPEKSDQMAPGEATTANDTTLSVSRRSRRKFRHHLGFFRPLLRFVLMVVVPITAAVYGALWWGESMRYVTTENAYVKSNVIAISADVDGRIIAVDARENERVNGGQILLRIDPRPFEIEIAEASAELERAKAEIEALRADYRSGQRAIRSRNERVRYLQGEFDRQQKLTKRGVGTGAKLDQARHELEMSRREVDTVRERNRMLLAVLGGDPAIKVENHPKYLSALANLDRAELDFDRTNVLAPADGIVGNINLQLGEYVEKGEALFSVVQIDKPWIEANLKETQLTYVEVGQAVSFFVDSYPDIEWQAKVASIAPATGAEFSLLPPQNASGNWVKVVQRLPVRLAITKKAGNPKLRAGMTVTVSIDTERDRSLGVMVRELVAWIGLEDTIPDAWLVVFDN